MAPNERFRYFVRKVTDFSEVWGLYFEGWAMAASDSGQKALVFWPEKEFAEICATAQWKDYEAY